MDDQRSRLPRDRAGCRRASGLEIDRARKVRHAIAEIQKFGGYALNGKRETGQGGLLHRATTWFSGLISIHLGAEYLDEPYNVMFVLDSDKKNLEDALAGIPVHPLTENERRSSFARMTAIKDLGNVSVLFALNMPTSDADLVHLKSLHSLEGLTLISCRGISDAGPANVKGLHSLTKLSLGRCPGISDVGVANLRHLRNLRELDLVSDRVGDRGLAFLDGLSCLEVLELESSSITEEGLGRLKRLTSLQKLCVTCDGMANPRLTWLRPLNGLKKLGLHCASISETGLASVGQLTRLESLMITAVEDAGDGLSHLKTLTRLETLGINQACLTERGISHLAALPHLHKLIVFHDRGLDVQTTPKYEALALLPALRDLVFGPDFRSRTPLEFGLPAGWKPVVDDDLLARLPELPGLRSLNLAMNPITDKSLSILTSLKNLESLELTDTSITDEGLAQLREMLPSTKISRR